MICVQVYLKCDDGFNGAAQRIAANSPVFQGGTLLEPTTVYTPSPARYDSMTYNHVGASGLKLPAVSLGFWHNFGDITPYDTMRQIVFTAFDNGVTHFDLANNYGPEPGSAEKNCGRLLHEYFHHHRDELIISTKAGYEMWLGPYGDLGSRKYLLASLDQSLERLGLDYVDIFYHHHMDSHTPLEETMGALATAVHSGKALYVGLSNYDGPTLEQATGIVFIGRSGGEGGDVTADMPGSAIEGKGYADGTPHQLAISQDERNTATFPTKEEMADISAAFNAKTDDEGRLILQQMDLDTDTTLGNTAGSKVYTTEKPTTNADNGLTLSDLRGVDFNDAKWDQLLDQLEWPSRMPE